MTTGETGEVRPGVGTQTLAGGRERFAVVSDDDDWVHRVASVTAAPIDRVSAESPVTDMDGYPAAVVVDGAGPRDPMEWFAAVRDAYPDTACLLAGGGTRVDGDATAPDRPIVVEYLPDRDPPSVAAAAEHAVEMRTHRGYPIGEAEDDRVELVRTVGSTGIDHVDGFDGISDAAAAPRDVEVATVSLLGEYRLHLVGASDDRFPPVVDRARSISTYTVLEDGVHTIPDLAADPRFEADCLALESGLHAYAGVPIYVDGWAVGSVSAFRRTPGAFEAATHESLVALAGVAASLIATTGDDVQVADASVEASTTGDE